MALAKFDAKVNVEIDHEAKKVVFVCKEDAGEETKLLFDADVAYKIGCKLEAYALMLKQSEREEEAKQ